MGKDDRAVPSPRSRHVLPELQPLDALVADWVRRGIATRPSLPVGIVPPGCRLMPLDQIVADLARDREDS